MSIPIYLHFNDNLARYHYSPMKELSGWETRGVAFQAFEKQCGDTVPIYQLWNNTKDPVYYLYSMSPDQGSDWTNDGALFYALNKETEGAVPVYDYYDAAIGWRHMFSLSPTAGPGWIRAGIAFWALPADIEYHYDLVEIKYGDIKEPPPDSVDIIKKQDFTNRADVEIEETFEANYMKASTFEWGLTETLQVGAEQTFEANIPFTAGSKTTLSITLGLEAHQNFHETYEETYKISTTVKIPKRTGATVTSYIDWVDNYKTDFRLWFLFWVSSKSHGKLNTNQLRKLLSCGGFTGKIEDDQRENELIVSISGTFSGTYGLRTRVDTEEIPL